MKDEEKIAEAIEEAWVQWPKKPSFVPAVSPTFTRWFNAEEGLELGEVDQTIYQVLQDLWDEYTIQREQFGDDPIWIKYEDTNVIERAAQILHEREREK